MAGHGTDILLTIAIRLAVPLLGAVLALGFSLGRYNRQRGRQSDSTGPQVPLQDPIAWIFKPGAAKRASLLLLAGLGLSVLDNVRSFDSDSTSDTRLLIEIVSHPLFAGPAAFLAVLFAANRRQRPRE